MRILYSHRIQSRDGQSVHVEELVSAFRKAGHEVLVVGPGLYEKADFGGESALVAKVRRMVPKPLSELAEVLYNLSSFVRLRRAQRRFKPDFTYERYNLYHLAGTLLKRLYGVPLYLEVNAPLAEERARFGGLRLRGLARRLEALVWRSADRVFVVTEVLKEVVANAGVAREKIAVIPNGIDCDAFPAAPYRARPGASVTIGFVGFVRDWHGLDAVISGLAAHRGAPAVRFLVVGDGPARPKLEHQAEALGAKALVQFAGLKGRESIAEAICGFDIALQPRAVAYASPLKLFEYMACGRAIVAPDQPNIREILKDGETAILFDPEEEGAVWRAICRLAGDAHLREALGEAARKAIEAGGYTWEGNAAKITAAAAAQLERMGRAETWEPACDRVQPPQSG